MGVGTGDHSCNSDTEPYRGDKWRIMTRGSGVRGEFVRSHTSFLFLGPFLSLLPLSPNKNQKCTGR